MVANIVARGLRRVFNATLENPAVPINDPRAYDYLTGGGSQTDAGIAVSHRGSLSLAAVWQAVSTISGDTALAPLDVYRRSSGDDREVDYNHPAQFLISTRPNPEMSAYEFWRRLQLHTEIWGNGYAYIRREGRLGKPIELLNLLPDRTTWHRTKDTGMLYYLTEVDGVLEPLFAEEVFHLQGISIQPEAGLDPLQSMKNDIGLALAAEGFASRFFASGSQSGGILELPAGVSERYADNVEEGFRKRYTGKDGWFKTVILRDGAKFHATTVDAEKSQMSDVREEQARQVARRFNMPPFKLGLQDSQGYNSTEMAQLVYITGCLSHRFASLVGEASIKLLTEDQQRSRSHYIEPNLSKLIEIDVKTLNEVLEIQRRNLVINANEWRRKINLNRRTDAGGNEYVNPNTAAKPTVPAPNANDNANQGNQNNDNQNLGNQNPGAGRGGSQNATAQVPCRVINDWTTLETSPANRVEEHLRTVVRDVVERAARRVGHDARVCSKKPNKFLTWLDSRASDHRAAVDSMLRAPLGMAAAMCGKPAEPLLCDITGRFFADLLADLSPLIEPPYKSSELESLVDARCTAFEQSITDKILPLIFPQDC